MNDVQNILATMPFLRPYQVGYVTGNFEGWKTARSGLNVAATGAGKTITGSATIKAWLETHDTDVLWIAHRRELNRQAIESIERVTGHKPDLEMGNDRVDTRANLLGSGSRVVVASIQSLNAGRRCTECSGTGGVLVPCHCKGKNPECGDCEGSGKRPSKQNCPLCLGGTIRRLQKFSPERFGLTCVDESHRSLSTSYRRVLNWFSQCKENKFLFLTATPQRSGNQSLGIICDFASGISGKPHFGKDAESAEIADLKWCVDHGWLCPVAQRFIECTHLDLSHVHTKGGELDDAELQEALMEERTIHEMVMGTVQHTGNKKTVVFCTDCSHAEAVTDLFNRYKPNSARLVTGKTEEEERAKTLADHKAGAFQYLCNVDVLTEGYDDPGIEVVAMMRPHKTAGAYIQKVGRGARPIAPPTQATVEERRQFIASSSKPRAEVIDFCGENGRHKLISILDVLCGSGLSQELLDRAKRIAMKSHDAEDPESLLKEAEKQLKEEEERKRKELEAKRRAAIAAREAQFRVTERDPFSWWDKLPKATSLPMEATKDQKDALRKMGVDDQRLAGINKDSAGAMLRDLQRRRMKGLCSYKQAKFLAKHGFDTGSMRFQTASAIITAMKANGWQVTERIRAMAKDQVTT